MFWYFCYVNNQIKTTAENLTTQPGSVPSVHTDSLSNFVAFIENGTKLKLTTPSMKRFRKLPQVPTHITNTKDIQRPWRLLWKATEPKLLGVATPLSTVELVEAFWLSLLGKLTDSTGWFSYSIHSHCICNGLYYLHYIYMYPSWRWGREKYLQEEIMNLEKGEKRGKEFDSICQENNQSLPLSFKSKYRYAN